MRSGQFFSKVTLHAPDGNRYADRKRRRRRFVVTCYFVMCKVGCETKLNNRSFIVPLPGNPNRQVF